MKISIASHCLTWLLFSGEVATTNTVFDVSRSSRITCEKENDGCVLHGSISSQKSSGFSDPFNQDSVTRSNGKKDSFLELSSCWDFDCTAECDPSCSCLRMATQDPCPMVGDDDNNTSHPSDKKNPVFNILEPHLFHNLQDMRLECTESRSQCVITGFEGCGYTVPRYNLYNDETGLFVVDDASKGDTSLEIRGCNAVFGTADCDAGCTCHDLATNNPCDFVVLPPRAPLPQLPALPKIVFEDLHKASLTCHAAGDRCDELNPSNVCGSEAGANSARYITSEVQPATLRVDKTHSAAAVTFSACYSDQTFAMECDSSCVCIVAETGRPCLCTNSSAPDGACTIDHDWALVAVSNRKLGVQIVGGILIACLLVVGWFLERSVKKCSSKKVQNAPGNKPKRPSFKLEGSLAYEKLPPEDMEDKISVEAPGH